MRLAAAPYSPKPGMKLLKQAGGREKARAVRRMKIAWNSNAGPGAHCPGWRVGDKVPLNRTYLLIFFLGFKDELGKTNHSTKVES